MNAVIVVKKYLPLILMLALPVSLFAQLENKPVGTAYFSDPSISPDANEIAFVSGGDIWTVPANGGEARLLVSHPAYDSRPLYSPDGRWLAFASTRTGNGDIYVLNISSGQLNRLTYGDFADEVSAWSADGKYIYFSSVSHDIGSMRDVYRVRMEGGTPMPVSGNRYVNEFFAAPSPDGKTLALTAHGVASHQWWRHGRSHLDESEIWLMHADKNNSYELLTEKGAKHLWPMWSRDGKSLFYVSDKTGTENLFVKPLGGTAKQLTTFKTGRLLWPTISSNGKAIVFERDFKVWHYDIASGKAAEVKIIRRGSPAAPGLEHVRLMTSFRNLALSPDGKKIAFLARGNVFAVPSKEGGDAVRVTNAPGIASQVVWAGNSNSVVYVSDRDGISHLYQYNFITNIETKLTNEKTNDSSPKFSPDGKILSFIRDGKELRLIDLASKKETLLTKALIEYGPFLLNAVYSWSPDNKWIAYVAFGDKAFRNIYVIPASGGQGKPVSFLANSYADGICWGKDSRFILFNTGQRTENAFVARVDLVPQTPRFREDQFQSLFMEPTSTPSNQVNKTTTGVDTLFKVASKKENDEGTIVWQGLKQRSRFLPLGVDVDEQVISPDGNTLAVIATTAGQTNIYTYSLDELSKEPPSLKQVTTTASLKSNLQFSPDGKDLFFIDQGRLQSVSIDSRVVKPLPVTVEMDIDFNKEKQEIFKQAWTLENKGFYDPNFHGADWNAIRNTYEPLVEGAGTIEELRRILSLMVGELNASHLGVGGSPGQTSMGNLGLGYDKNEYENNGRLKITDITDLGAADVSGKIHVGDYLKAIDGVVITGATNVDELLDNKIGKQVTLTIGTSATDNEGKKINVRPVSTGTEKALLYTQWVQQQRAYVDKVSKGRLGYIHMFDMSQESLNQLYIDMDAENHSKAGVIVDIRNNNGGFVNPYALDILSRRGYLTMTIRGLPAAPARVQLGQRALDAPTILVTNQHSLSDAEDFAEGYRTLGLGKIVGEPTGGWIIFTSNITLFDGTVVRMPFSKITDNEGKNMELNPRPVDIPVSNPLGEKDKDSQLDTAVNELLKQIDKDKAAGK